MKLCHRLILSIPTFHFSKKKPKKKNQQKNQRFLNVETKDRISNFFFKAMNIVGVFLHNIMAEKHFKDNYCQIDIPLFLEEFKAAFVLDLLPMFPQNNHLAT